MESSFLAGVGFWLISLVLGSSPSVLMAKPRTVPGRGVPVKVSMFTSLSMLLSVGMDFS